MRSGLERAALHVIDVFDQPSDSKFIAVAEGSQTPTVGIACEDFRVSDTGTTLMGGDGNTIASFSPHIAVSVYRRDLLELMTREALVRQSNLDQQAGEKLAEELRPEDAETVQGARRLERMQIADMLRRMETPTPGGGYR